MFVFFCDGVRFPVQRSILEGLTLFQKNPGFFDCGAYQVKSHVSHDTFSTFLELVWTPSETSAMLTNDNCQELEELCSEFGCEEVKHHLRKFREARSADLENELEEMKRRFEDQQEMINDMQRQISSLKRVVFLSQSWMRQVLSSIGNEENELQQRLNFEGPDGESEQTHSSVDEGFETETDENVLGPELTISDEGEQTLGSSEIEKKIDHSSSTTDIPGTTAGLVCTFFVKIPLFIKRHAWKYAEVFCSQDDVRIKVKAFFETNWAAFYDSFEKNRNGLCPFTYDENSSFLFSGIGPYVFGCLAKDAHGTLHFEEIKKRLQGQKSFPDEEVCRKLLAAYAKECEE